MAPAGSSSAASTAVHAAQLNSESDSYGPDYDKDATYPVTTVTGKDELINAIANATEDIEVVLAADIDLGLCESTILDKK